MANSSIGLAAYAGVVALVCLALALAGAVIWLASRLRRLEARYEMLLQGTDGGDLQTVLESHVAEVRTALQDVRRVTERADRLEEAACGHVQHLGLVRYNPFRDTGGDQSFVLALADGRGNGAIITSLHMRDVTRVYAKPLASWTSGYPLTDEEQRALRVARGTAA